MMQLTKLLMYRYYLDAHGFMHENIIYEDFIMHCKLKKLPTINLLEDFHQYVTRMNDPAKNHFPLPGRILKQQDELTETELKLFIRDSWNHLSALGFRGMFINYLKKRKSPILSFVEELNKNAIT